MAEVITVGVTEVTGVVEVTTEAGEDTGVIGCRAPGGVGIVSVTDFIAGFFFATFRACFISCQLCFCRGKTGLCWQGDVEEDLVGFVNLHVRVMGFENIYAITKIPVIATGVRHSHELCECALMIDG